MARAFKLVRRRTESRSTPTGRTLEGDRGTDAPGETMTGRTTSTPAEHGLTVLDGGLAGRRFSQDELEATFDPAWLAREMQEAASLCDRLEAEGRRIAFTPRGNGEAGLSASLRDLLTNDVLRDLDTRDVVDVDRLTALNGMSA